jgi:catecholate siderophore receptor
VQTGSQRSKGVEVGASGRITSRWQVAGGFASQQALITSATTAAPAGATVPFVPRTTISLWNRYQVTSRLGAALGVVHRTGMYAAVDNTVVIPAYTVADGAMYADLTRTVRAQVNIGNLFNANHYLTAHSNNNISPGAPRSLRIGVTTTF